tara:strand:+ start:186 stop:497 length:312 start_codon:yes stop_codon:yes gene_type:complete
MQQVKIKKGYLGRYKKKHQITAALLTKLSGIPHNTQTELNKGGWMRMGTLLKILTHCPDFNVHNAIISRLDNDHRKALEDLYFQQQGTDVSYHSIGEDDDSIS